MHTYACRRTQSFRHSVLSLAVSGALLLLAAPAWAQDPPCVNPDSSVIAPRPSTDQGNEAGQDNTTCSDAASAYGESNNASGASSSAFGYSNTASGDYSSAFGRSNSASGLTSSAFGYFNTASGFYSSAFGNDNTASGVQSSAFGYYNTASGFYNSAFGYFNTASGDYSSPFGYLNNASGASSSAFGFQSAALQASSTALGYQAVANEAGVVSFGHAATDLSIQGVAYGSDLNARLIHVAAGINATDAVNMSQLSPLATALGGGANYASGVFTAPSYNILGLTYNNVGEALAAINSWMAGGGNGVQYDDATQADVTLAGTGGTQIHNLADGTEVNDAANLGQVQAGDVATLASANAHADAGAGFGFDL